MKIGIHRSETERSAMHVEKINQVVPNASVTFFRNLSSRVLQELDIIITGDPKKIDKIPKNLKWLHVPSAGVNHIPDSLFQSDIIITNSSGVHPIPIAEQICAYMLILARQMRITEDAQKKKIWIKDELNDIQELYGKNICIIGMGRIGSRLAHLANAFGMSVTGVAKRKKIESHDVKYLSLSQLINHLPEFDYVVNCLPLTEETKGFYNKRVFQEMKKSATFINIGRGQSVVEKDLIQALKSKEIKSAALDVFEEEPLPKESPLWEMENVIITPHHAGLTPQYMDRVMDIFCQNLSEYPNAENMPNAVNKTERY